MDIGKRIKELRQEKNLTLEELGNLVGVGKSTVRKWETGMIQNMKRDKIAKLADVLNVSPAFLLGYDDQKINAVSEMQKDANEYETKIHAILEEIYDLDLIESEAVDVVMYAKFIRSKRK